MTKYAALEAHLRESGQDTVPMTFADIARVIGADLPPSAFKHRPWWSNNPSNSSITRSWLEAGYKTENESGAPQLQDAAPAHVAAEASSFSSVFGALKGTVTIKPGTDLTAPVEADWEALR